MAGHALSISVISVEAGLAGLKAKINQETRGATKGVSRNSVLKQPRAASELEWAEPKSGAAQVGCRGISSFPSTLRRAYGGRVVSFYKSYRSNTFL